MSQTLIHCFRVFLITALSLMPMIGSAQPSRQDSLWLPLRFLIGSWEGQGVGQPGMGEYERTYRLVLNKRFIEVKNKSVYPSSEKKPKGEVHEDWGFFSYDKGRRTFVLRQFHVEGFVNQYKLDSISTDGRTIVFTSEAIENIPRGWRARETYDILDSNRVRETFELAEPNKEFELYTRVELNRVN